MLKQMLSDDRNEAVREAVTKSLALVVAFIENEDKYEQVQHKYVYWGDKCFQCYHQVQCFKCTETQPKVNEHDL